MRSCLRAKQPKLYHVSFRGRVSRAALPDANLTRDSRIYADIADCLLPTAHCLLPAAYGSLHAVIPSFDIHHWRGTCYVGILLPKSWREERFGARARKASSNRMLLLATLEASRASQRL